MTRDGDGVGGLKIPTGVASLAVLAIVLLAVKLILVSQHEIIVEPYDALGYVTVSIERLSLYAFHSHPPGASYVMWCARALGIPYRVFEEILLALALFLFLRPLVFCRLGLVVAVLVFPLMMFNPTLLTLMDRAMADPSNVLFVLAGLGGVLGVALAPRDRLPIFSFVLTIAAFGFLALIRDDGPILWVTMAAAAVFSLIFWRNGEAWRFRRAIVACGCAVIANLIAGQAMAAAAYHGPGYWGSSAVQSREWWGLYAALLALPVPRTERHALVNERNRELAAELSPTFAKSRACLEEAPTRARGNGAIQWWVMRCTHYDIQEVRRMRAEIIEGAQRENIELQWPLLGLIPKPVSQWAPSLIPSALHVLRIVESTPPTVASNLHDKALQDVVAEDKSFSIENTEKLFNEGLLRRSALADNTTNPEIEIYKRLLFKIYAAVSTAGLFATGIVLLLAPIVLFIRGLSVRESLIIFSMALVSFQIAANIGYYTIVDWIGWAVASRYVISSQVLLAFPPVALTAVLLARLWTPIRQGRLSMRSS